MIKYDDSSLNVEQRGKLPFYEGLLDFAHQVSLAKPMINFVVDHKCVANRFIKAANGRDTEHFICGFIIFENGEELGAIGTEHRYRGGDRDLVYEVESFRIDKSRGNQNAKQSKDIKVALRIAKKMLVARADDEAKELIRELVMNNISNYYGNANNAVRYSMSINEEAYLYAKMAYQARQRGETSVVMPSKIASAQNITEHDKACANADDAYFIKNLVMSDQGYGVQVLANGNYYVYSFADKSITRYDDFYSLPDNIQGKYAVFKVLKNAEIVTTIGVKINDEFAYVVP